MSNFNPFHMLVVSTSRNCVLKVTQLRLLAGPVNLCILARFAVYKIYSIGAGTGLHARKNIYELIKKANARMQLVRKFKASMPK